MAQTEEQTKNRQREYYEKNKERYRQRYLESREAKIEYSRKYKEENRERVDLSNKAYLLKKYAVTVAEWQEMLIKQDHQCAICAAQLCRGTGRSALDHCHTTGAIRKILCAPCNKGLGFFRDSPDSLRKAAAYLELHLD